MGREAFRNRNQIYLLPSLFTTMNLLCGFYAIVEAIGGRFERAAFAIFLAVFFDGVDGRVARLTKTTTLFGKEYDSLSDLVSFGIAPAVFAYQYGLTSFGRFGQLAAFLYAACTALRLARFNVQDPQKASPKHFVGLPSPAAGSMVVFTYYFLDYVEPAVATKNFALAGMTYLLAYFMVSTHPYLSFKHPATRRIRTFQALVAMVLLVVVVATEPRVTLFLVGGVYLLSGPGGDLWRLLWPVAPAAGVRQESDTVPRWGGDHI